MSLLSDHSLASVLPVSRASPTSSNVTGCSWKREKHTAGVCVHFVRAACVCKASELGMVATLSNGPKEGQDVDVTVKFQRPSIKFYWHSATTVPCRVTTAALTPATQSCSAGRSLALDRKCLGTPLSPRFSRLFMRQTHCTGSYRRLQPSPTSPVQRDANATHTAGTRVCPALFP